MRKRLKGAKIMANIKNIYLAGGCFWGVEYFFGWLKGVLETEVGYANGDCEENANYRTVLTGQTGFRECAKITFDMDEVSLDALLHTFFFIIDTESENRQGPDVGSQYQSGIYYDDLELKDEIERIAAVEKKRTPGFAVEITPLKNYFKAEKEHQKYLIKNPRGYCHISPLLLDFFTDMKIDPKNYKLPTDAEIKEKLTPLQYEVTQNAGTEPPFQNEYFDKFEEGIYVDIVTGEPLFSSKDKYKSSCGWPAFKKPIELPSVFEKPDNSMGLRRTEVVSRTGSTHLGHLFTGDPEPPSGLRYCINSASIRFIPKDEMEKEGYGFLLHLFG